MTHWNHCLKDQVLSVLRRRKNHSLNAAMIADRVGYPEDTDDDNDRANQAFEWRIHQLCKELTAEGHVRQDGMSFYYPFISPKDLYGPAPEPRSPVPFRPLRGYASALQRRLEDRRHAV